MAVQILQEYATQFSEPEVSVSVPMQRVSTPGSAFVIGISMPAGYTVASVTDPAGNIYEQIEGAYISDTGSGLAANAWWTTNSAQLRLGQSITGTVNGDPTTTLAVGYVEVLGINDATPVVVNQIVQVFDGSSFNGPSLDAGNFQAFYLVISAAFGGATVSVAAPWFIDPQTVDENSGYTLSELVGTNVQQALFTPGPIRTFDGPQIGLAFPGEPTHTISGNAGVGGATVSWSGTSTGSTTADDSGNYTTSGLADGDYTITPNLNGYTFSPTSQNTSVSGSDITGIDFTATPGPPTHGWSPVDCRDYATFPNIGVVQNSGAVFYTGQESSNSTIPPVDSRAAGAPVDSRAAGAPVNCRVTP